MVGLIGLLGGAALLWSTMSGAPQRDLFAGMGDADKAAVADALKAANIPYAVDRDTGSLTVPETSFYQAKMLLAQQGLPKAAPRRRRPDLLASAGRQPRGRGREAAHPPAEMDLAPHDRGDRRGRHRQGPLSPPSSPASSCATMPSLRLR